MASQFDLYMQDMQKKRNNFIDQPYSKVPDSDPMSLALSQMASNIASQENSSKEPEVKQPEQKAPAPDVKPMPLSKDTQAEVKAHIADQAGVKPKEVEKALPVIQQALKEEAPKAIEKKQTSADLMRELLTKIDENAASAKEKESQQKVAMTLAAIIPTLAGFALGGYQGGALGAQVGSKATLDMNQEIKDEEKKGLENLKTKASIASQVAEAEGREKSQEIQKLGLEKELQVLQENMRHNRAVETQTQKNNEAQRAIDWFKLQKESLPKTTAQKMKDLPESKAARLDNVVMALKSVYGMKKALAEGQWTVSPIGDNDFTLSKTGWAESLGRMQSGGAISKPEEKRFGQFAPGPADKAPMQQKKLGQGEAEMLSRLKTLGFEPSEFPDLIAAQQEANAAAEKAAKGDKMTSPGMDQAVAAPQKPDFSKMSDAELKKYLGH